MRKTRQRALLRHYLRLIHVSERRALNLIITLGLLQMGMLLHLFKVSQVFFRRPLGPERPFLLCLPWQLWPHGLFLIIARSRWGATRALRTVDIGCRL